MKQVSKSSFSEYFFVMGITVRRCSSVVAFNEIAMFTGISLSDEAMLATIPTLDTVIFRLDSRSA